MNQAFKPMEEWVAALEDRPQPVGAVRILLMLAALLGFLFVSVLYLSAQSEHDAKQAAYQNSLAACQRGNPLRGVVFRNTYNSIAQSVRVGEPKSSTDVFRANYRALLATPYLNPKTGEVDCQRAVTKP